LVGAAMIVPAGVSVYYKEWGVAKSFAVCFVPMIVIGLLAIKLTPKADNEVLRMRDGFFIVAVAWIVMSILGALPFMISGSIPNFCDAFFETASGFSTTGSTVLSQPELLPRGILFWRSFTHWLGGMGVLVLTIALLPMLGIGGQKIMRAETTGPTMDKISFTTNETAKKLYIIYGGMTVLEIILLWTTGMGLFDACCNTFGTVGTGGLATNGASIGYYGKLSVEMIVAVFMMLAGINFSLYYQLITGNVKSFFKDKELRVYLAIIAGATIFIAAMLYCKSVYGSIGEALRYAYFQVCSIITTTGYGTADFDLWPIPCKVIILCLMFVGGCGGSTGGGMKVIRIILLWKLLKRGIDKKLHPRATAQLKFDSKPVSVDTLSGVASFAVLYLVTILAGSLFVSLSGCDLITSVTSVIACVSNIGPGFNLVGPSCTFAFFPGIIKIVLGLLMIAGRLELFTIILLFTPQYWNKNR
ncbi:MAG: TrkH family potassium uptake protein, partial [Bacillota bacterium]|nr:TrkH family potassium uptake protein [Bacillota bacterium]